MINLDKSENWDSWEDWLETKKACYGSKTVLQTYTGIIDFDPDKQEDLVGGEKLSYDEYLDLLMMACEHKGKVRWTFAQCYYNCASEFMGQIERITTEAVCFKRINVSGIYPDGSFFDGKEDHVWIDKKGLEEYKVGDSLSFFAEVYRYIKTSNGKQIDYGLRNLENIEKIEKYELPSDEELLLQSINSIICESCFLYDTCNGTPCLRNKREIQALRMSMLKTLQEQQTESK